MFEKEKIPLIIVTDEGCMSYAYHLRDLIGENEKNISTVIYTDKQYIDFRANIDSNTHIVFIGNSKLAKQNQEHIPDRFHKYGMHYGWMGKTAVLYVDDIVLPQEEWSGLLDLVHLNKKIMNLPKNLLFYTPLYISLNSYNNFKKNKKEVCKQQYGCLITEWYIDGFSEFIEN